MELQSGATWFCIWRVLPDPTFLEAVSVEGMLFVSDISYIEKNLACYAFPLGVAGCSCMLRKGPGVGFEPTIPRSLRETILHSLVC